MSENSVAQVRAPTAAAVRTQVGHFFELWLGALFLKPQVYAYQREQKNPFANGLLYIAIIGVIIALAGIIGTGLRYATTPSLEAIKNIILAHLLAMPFYDNLSSASQDAFLRGFNQVWNLIGSVFVGYPTNAASFAGLILTILTTPLGLVIGWIFYGALVHLVARGWNPETSFSELLAPLALATTPQLIHVLSIFPEANVSGLVIGLWSLVCSIFAIRIAYKTTTRRALWGAFFPLLVFTLLLIIPILLGLFLLAAGRGGR